MSRFLSTAIKRKKKYFKKFLRCTDVYAVCVAIPYLAVHFHQQTRFSLAGGPVRFRIRPDRLSFTPGFARLFAFLYTVSRELIT